MRADLLFDRFRQTSDLTAVLKSVRAAAARASTPLVLVGPSDFSPLLDEALFGSGDKQRCASVSAPSGVLHPAVASLLGDLLELESEALLRVARGQARLEDGTIHPLAPGDPPLSQTGLVGIAGLLPKLPPDDPGDPGSARVLRASVAQVACCGEPARDPVPPARQART